MANDETAALRTLTLRISDSDTPLQSLGQTVMEYGMLLRNTLTRSRAEFAAQRELRESSRLDSGNALSPWNAASCIEDQVRTAAFIRGAIQGIENLLATTRHRPLHLLEAGCGPLGTLALPLLAPSAPTNLWSP